MPQNGITPQDQDIDDGLDLAEDPDDQDGSDEEFLDDLDAVLTDEWP